MRLRVFLAWALAAILAGSTAADTIGGGGVSGLRTHNHSSASKGGATLSGTTLSGTTLSGTTTNTGVLSGGTLKPTVISSSSDTDQVRIRPNSVSQTAPVFEVQNATGSAVFLSVAMSGQVASSNGLSVGGSLTSTKACASGYNRAGPNFCRGNAAGVVRNSLTAGVCTTLAFNSDAKVGLLWLQAETRSANSIAARSSAITVFDDGSCSIGPNVAVSAQAYEFSAIAAGTVIAVDSAEMAIPLNGSGQAFVKWTGTGAAYYEKRGYFD